MKVRYSFSPNSFYGNWIESFYVSFEEIRRSRKWESIEINLEMPHIMIATCFLSEQSQIANFEFWDDNFSYDYVAKSEEFPDWLK